ncbi:polymorphic toxin type 50 domain-containing protein [Lactococcus garvieae]
MVIYNSGDSDNLIQTLSENLKSAKQIFEKVNQGTQHLNSVIDSGILSGAAYRAGQTLFQSKITPMIQKLSLAINDIQGDLDSYKKAEQEVRALDSRLDEEYLTHMLNNVNQMIHLVEQKIEEDKKILKKLMSGGFDELVQGLAEIPGLEQQLENLKQLKSDYERKIQALQKFASTTSSLFTDSMQSFKYALQGVDIINQSKASSDGTITFPAGANMSWLSNLQKQKLSSRLTSDDKVKIKYSSEPDTLNAMQELSSTMGISLEEAEKLYLQFQKIGNDKKDTDKLRQMTEEIKLRSAHSEMTFDEYMEYCFTTFTIVASFGGAYGMAKTLGWGKRFLDWWEARSSTNSIEKPIQTPQPKLNFEGTPHIHQGKQDKHMEGSLNYKQQVSNGKNPSILTADPKQLLRDFSGKGKPTGDLGTKERVDFGKPIGKYYNNRTGEYEITNKGIIHYDKNGGAHIVPARP